MLVSTLGISTFGDFRGIGLVGLGLPSPEHTDDTVMGVMEPCQVRERLLEGLGGARFPRR